jgi:hypothetical protein
VSVQIGDVAVSAAPFWWPPLGQANFTLRMTITADSAASAAGQIAWVALPNVPNVPIEQSAYLGARERVAIAAAAQR